MGGPKVEKAVIVGAGVGGLSAAIALGRAGVEAKVFERHEDPRVIESGGGFILWNNAMKALAQIDLDEEVEAQGARLKLADWKTSRGKALGKWPILDVEEKVGAPALGIRRQKLQSVLVNAVPNGVLERGVECTGYVEEDHRVRVQLADGREEEADLLVGADGIRSTVRAKLHGGLEEPRYAGYVQNYGVIAYDTDVHQEGVFRELDGTGHRYFIVPVGENEIYWAGSTPGPPARIDGKPAGAEVKKMLLDIFGDWVEPTGGLIEATPEDRIFRRDIYDRDPLDWWGRGRVTLLGDSAHPITPNLGQGACQAIEGAVVLAKLLAQRSDPEDALKEYETSRIPRTSSFVKRSRLIGNLGLWQSRLACDFRNLIGRATISGVAFRQHVKDQAHEF
jgi:2-polyprenyl-6-methoxyphenol hydroxylase-like FAD-dependent oxidoreductase